MSDDQDTQLVYWPANSPFFIAYPSVPDSGHQEMAQAQTKVQAALRGNRDPAWLWKEKVGREEAVTKIHGNQAIVVFWDCGW